PPRLAHAPRVALVLQVFQHPGGLDGEGRLDQHLVAPHVVDVVDVLDVDRAFVHAGTTVGAGPDHVRVDHAVRSGGTDQWSVWLLLEGIRKIVPFVVRGCDQVGGPGERVVAQVKDDHLGRQRLAGDPGRALRLAPPALGAGAHVEEALPGEVLDL